MRGQTVLADVDESLRALLASSTFPGQTVRVDLDAPNKEWSGRRTAPGLNLFLADIRENLELRRVDPIEIRNDEGHVTARQPHPRYYALTYVLTAWAATVEDEHRLLGSALTALLRSDYMPDAVSTGLLAEQIKAGYPVRLRVGGTLFTERMATELWSSLGSDYRPSISVTVIVPFPAGAAVPAGPPQTQPPQVRVTDTREPATSEVISGAQPQAPEAGIRTRARADRRSGDYQAGTP
ncbi:MAG: DUF4255 domain-containing protein [Actinomycetales bacterium]|nr:DUF4255 domain-containing protein [Actinomycetales bacterium]